MVKSNAVWALAVLRARVELRTARPASNIPADSNEASINDGSVGISALRRIVRPTLSADGDSANGAAREAADRRHARRQLHGYNTSRSTCVRMVGIWEGERNIVEGFG